jgi:hypothetical protein
MAQILAIMLDKVEGVEDRGSSGLTISHRLGTRLRGPERLNRSLPASMSLTSRVNTAHSPSDARPFHGAS